MTQLSRVAVFCGSKLGARPEYAEAAAALGAELAARGIGLVYGGGSVGLMGAIASATLAAGGEVIGVIPRKLLELEVGHSACTELVVVEDMHERKAKMAARADAFIAMPGGYGTLDESFEALTWTQLRYHAKPLGLLNVAGYFDLLIQFLERSVAEGFLRPSDHGNLIHGSTPGGLLDALCRTEISAERDWEELR